MDALKKFADIAANPLSYARQWKEATSQKIIGYLCSYVPEEIIHAAGALPFRVFGDTVSITRADAHLQAYCCSLARSSLEQALAGRLDFLDATVFPHTCDTIQRLSDIWRLNTGFPLHFDVVHPAKLNTESSFRYLVDVLHQFRADMENGLAIEITDENLRATIHLYNQIRQKLEKLYRMKSENPGCMAGSDVYAVTRAAMLMDRTDFLAHITELITSLQGKTNSIQQSHHKRLLLAGSICSHPNIYSILEDAGGAVVWDDLCTGSRFFNGEIDENADPIQAIAGRYFERPICPAKHRDLSGRGEYLVRLAKEHRADGVIFLLLKFCDPHAFDYPYLKAYLDNEGIPNMLLEVEDQLPATGQLRTRLEAFVEML